MPRIGVLETQSPPASKVLQADDLILSVDGVRGYAPGQSDAEIERRAKALRNAIAAHKCAGRSGRRLRRAPSRHGSSSSAARRS